MSPLQDRAQMVAWGRDDIRQSTGCGLSLLLTSVKQSLQGACSLPNKLQDTSDQSY